MNYKSHISSTKLTVSDMKKTSIFLLNLTIATTLLSACSTSSDYKQAKIITPPGKVYVIYSKYETNDRYSINYNTPEFITIVTPASVIARNSIGTGFSIVSSFLGGQMSLTASKEQMTGSELEDANKNKIPNPFTKNLEDKLTLISKEWISKNPDYQAKVYEKPIYIYNGHSRLVYEELTGVNSEKYRLIISSTIVKEQELKNSSRRYKSFECDFQSPKPRSETEWRAANFELLKKELIIAEKSCEERVIANLPLLLAQ